MMSWDRCPPSPETRQDEPHFDRAHARIVRQGYEHRGDPRHELPGQINNDHRGRGVYLLDPSGHHLRLLTNPYI